MQCSSVKQLHIKLTFLTFSEKQAWSLSFSRCLLCQSKSIRSIPSFNFLCTLYSLQAYIIQILMPKTLHVLHEHSPLYLISFKFQFYGFFFPFYLINHPCLLRLFSVLLPISLSCGSTHSLGCVHHC